MIHIGRAGSKLGSFSEFEVRQGLKAGKFFLTDLGWKEGMENWAPLSQFTEFETPPEPMPPLPEAESSEAAVTTIPGLPWDFRRELGIFRAFFLTARVVLLKPAEAFARMIPAGSLAGPLLYNMIGAWFGALCSAGYLLLTSKGVQPPPASAGQLVQMFYVSPEKAMELWHFYLFFGWAIVTLGTLVSSGIVHLLLMMAGGARKPFHVTLRVFCFTYGSVELLQIFPVAGGLFASALLVVYVVIGLAIAHEVSVWRPVTALGLFLFAGLVFFLGLVSMLTAAGIH